MTGNWDKKNRSCSLILKIRVVNLRLDKLGRAVPARKFKWTGPGRSGPNSNWAGPFRPKFLWAGPAVFANIPRRFRRYSAIFLKEQCLIWNELIIKIKFSLKNHSKIRIEIKLGMTGPARLRISADLDIFPFKPQFHISNWNQNFQKTIPCLRIFFISQVDF